MGPQIPFVAFSTESNRESEIASKSNRIGLNWCMATMFITHPACLGHHPPAGHPESPARLEAVLSAIKCHNFNGLEEVLAPLAERKALGLAHGADMVELILDQISPMAAEKGLVRIDADTAMSAGSAQAALRAAGAVIAAVDGVAKGQFANAFCAVRPPGHHAERNRPMGFCLFNNIAVGALHAREMHGFKRIAVVDFDVHHGNGTQDIFWNEPNLFYASTHQSPLYPGTGMTSEHGVADNILNVPLPEGADGKMFRAAFESRILPALDAFAPDFIFISAGFDAHRADPLAGLNLDESDFEWATREICKLASKHCNGRVVSALEGGYDLEALAASSVAHLRALTEA
jgi:acetoin utilization deacetylase AcuC-like enzyme